MEDLLQKRKQAVMRDALYLAALDLFVKQGFDETTVEEVASSAGVSRRTFFRYFQTKDDLLAHSMVNYTRILEKAVAACQPDATPLQVMTAVVYDAARFTERPEGRTREVVGISERSASARQAYLSRMSNVEDSLALAFAGHMKDASFRPRLLASITLTMINATIACWYSGETGDLNEVAGQVLEQVQGTFCANREAERTMALRGVVERKRAVKNLGKHSQGQRQNT